MKRSLTRRTVLQAIVLASVPAGSGCLATGGTGVEAPGTAAGRSDEPTDTATEMPTEVPTDTETETATRTPPPSATPVESVEAWLADANGYEGHLDDRTSDRTARINVGVDPRDRGEHFGFSAPGIRVPPGTTVTWEWTGRGGPHNVVATDGSFDSGVPVEAAGTTFDHTFEERGEYPYSCEPHETLGMKGAVVVEPLPASGNEAVDEWLWGIDAYEGEIVDRTATDATTVRVGAGNGDPLGFDPLAARVSTGTTVRWEWTGADGAHGVGFADAPIEDSEVTDEAGVHVEHAFEEPGVVRYYCVPHRTIGARGAIVVE